MFQSSKMPWSHSDGCCGGYRNDRAMHMELAPNYSAETAGTFICNGCKRNDVMQFNQCVVGMHIRSHYSGISMTSIYTSCMAKRCIQISNNYNLRVSILQARLHWFSQLIIIMGMINLTVRDGEHYLTCKYIVQLMTQVLDLVYR